MARMVLTRNVTGFGVRYFYNNVNYAILGMMIKAITGEAYGSYCHRTVLVPRGAPNARVGSGLRALEAFAAWEMSAREYAAFYYSAFNYTALNRDGRNWQFMNTAPSVAGGVVNGCARCNYGLGVFFRPFIENSSLTSFNTWHHGNWQPTSLIFPENFGAYSAKWSGNRYTVVVIYDRSVTSAERDALDRDLFNAANTADPTLGARAN